jgi:hypothetical protein
MGRPPIGKRAMTAAERQRRRHKRLRKERSDDWRRRERLMRRAKNADAFIPMPPGITYWSQVAIQPSDVGRLIWQPRTKPLAACGPSLEPDDVYALLRQLANMARGGHHSGMIACEPGDSRPCERALPVVLTS